LNEIDADTFYDRAYGSIFGAFIGDACGSFNEFNPQRKPIDSEFMKKCMSMPGGGPFVLGSGQITDDSELAMCVMEGIIQGID
jgi:ADP-ribosylglycohydrolase